MPSPGRRKSLQRLKKGDGARAEEAELVQVPLPEAPHGSVEISWFTHFQHTVTWYREIKCSEGRLPAGSCNLYTYPIVKFTAASTMVLAFGGAGAKGRRRRVGGDNEALTGAELAVLELLVLNAIVSKTTRGASAARRLSNRDRAQASVATV